MLPIVTRSGLTWVSPADRSRENLCGCIGYVLARAWGAHKDALCDPLCNLSHDAYLEWLNRLVGEVFRNMDFRPGVLAQLPVDDLECIYWFLISREDPA